MSQIPVDMTLSIPNEAFKKLCSYLAVFGGALAAGDFPRAAALRGSYDALRFHFSNSCFFCSVTILKVYKCQDIHNKVGSAVGTPGIHSRPTTLSRILKQRFYQTSRFFVHLFRYALVNNLNRIKILWFRLTHFIVLRAPFADWSCPIVVQNCNISLARVAAKEVLGRVFGLIFGYVEVARLDRGLLERGRGRWHRVVTAVPGNWGLHFHQYQRRFEHKNCHYHIYHYHHHKW